MPHPPTADAQPSAAPAVEAAPAAVVLLSGGLDSAVCLALARESGRRAICLSFDYGQRHAAELDAARRIAAAAGAQHRIVRIDLRAIGGSALTGPQRVPQGRGDEEMGRGIPATYVPARNLIFLSVAAALAEAAGAGEVFIGVNAIDYSGYPDCRPEFIAAFERAAALGTAAGVGGRGCRIVAPLLRLSKGGIVREGARLGVDFALTRSCYDPGAGGAPCRLCDACLLRARGFAEAGVDDPALSRPAGGGAGGPGPHGPGTPAPSPSAAESRPPGASSGGRAGML